MNNLKIDYVPIGTLTPYENNARRHLDFDVDAIAKSIEQFGMNDPIGVWGPDNIIVEGHGRYLALQKLGETVVPVVHLDHLTDEQRKAYGLAHNRTAELSTWDMDNLYAELDGLGSKFDMDSLFSEFLNNDEPIPDPEVHEDDFDIDVAIPIEPVSKLGDIYVLGRHRLMCGDSTDSILVNALLDGKVADCMFTDPPYNVNVHNSEDEDIENDNLEEEAFYSVLDGAFANASANLKPGGAFFCFHGDSERMTFQNTLEAHGLHVHQCVIWVKNSFNFGRQDFKWQHEPCLYGWTDGAAHYFVNEYNHPTVMEDSLDLDKMKKEDLKKLCEELLAANASIPGTVIHEDKPLKNDLHPTMKPIRLCSELIRLVTKRDDLVLDLFGGSGSTLIACEQLGRCCDMMELRPMFVDVIVKRFVKLVGSIEGCYLIRDGKQLPLPFHVED